MSTMIAIERNILVTADDINATLAGDDIPHNLANAIIKATAGALGLVEDGANANVRFMLEVHPG